MPYKGYWAGKNKGIQLNCMINPGEYKGSNPSAVEDNKKQGPNKIQIINLKRNTLLTLK